MFNYFYMVRYKVPLNEKYLIWIIIEIIKLFQNIVINNYFDLNFLLLDFFLFRSSFQKGIINWLFSFLFLLGGLFFGNQSHFTLSRKETFSLSQVIWSRNTCHLCPFKREKGKTLQSILFLFYVFSIFFFTR